MEESSNRQITNIVYNLKQYIFDNNVDKIKDKYKELIEKNIIKPFDKYNIDESNEDFYVIYLLLYPYVI